MNEPSKPSSRIADLPADERPRERLDTLGSAGALETRASCHSLACRRNRGERSPGRAAPAERNITKPSRVAPGSV